LNTNDATNARRIAEELAARFRPECFGDGVPFGMLELARGIGYAERHPEYSSHGSARSAAIELALWNLQTHRQRLAAVNFGLDEATAQHLLVHSFLPDAMRRLGIDPDSPHESYPNDEHYFNTE